VGKVSNYIIVGLVILALLGVGYFGYTLYPRWNKCPEITSDTVYLKDTVSHVILDTVPWYHLVVDTVIYTDTNFINIDTGAILKDYFAWHSYTRTWEDSLLAVTLHDIVSQNKFGGNEFTYKILRPQTIIQNVMKNNIYKKYILVGTGFTMKDREGVDLDAMYVNRRFYFGVGYNANVNSISFKGGITVLSW
jgi:hypothetical protein